MANERSLRTPSCTQSRRHIGNESGFALVAALLVLLGLSMLAAAGFLNSATDLAISENYFASVQAFYAADEGLSDVLGRNGTPRDSVTIPLTNFRSTTITSERILDIGSDRNLYQVTSVGRRIFRAHRSSSLRRRRQTEK